MTDENPYQSPVAAGETTVPATKPARETWRGAFIMSLLIQTIVLSFSALLLDGGNMARSCAAAALIYWIVAPLVMLRYYRSPSNATLHLVKYGFVMAIPVAVICIAAIDAVRQILP